MSSCSSAAASANSGVPGLERATCSDSSCAAVRWRGPPAWYGPYRKYCFEPPYVTGPGEPQVTCSTAYGVRGGCVNDGECGAGYTCQAGACRASSRVTGQPQVLRRLKPSHACAEGPLLIQEAGGGRSIVCPIPYENGSMPQCQNAFKNAWQCDRYAKTDRPKFYQCKSFESCFVYDAAFADGNVQPVSRRMDAECAGAAMAAQKKTAFACVTARPTPVPLPGTGLALGF